jgi:predicted MPP superfamily phosphohydrolase
LYKNGEMLMRKAGGRVLLGVLLFIVVLTIYTVWDNNRIKVVEQDIIIDNLPDTFEGYKILQITDLHEKEFGEKQENLIKEINAIDYDSIVFTGDMLLVADSTNYTPIYELLDGIKNKRNALFVPGNSDPLTYAYDLNNKMIKHEFIEGLEERGVKLLESIYSVKKGESYLHFADFEVSTLDTRKRAAIPKEEKLANYVVHRNQLLDKITKLDNTTQSDVLIALNHYPIVDAKIDQIINNPNQIFRDYDLILAGHYHGGQIRLPFIGALFVPEPYYERSGLFPPQDRVKGLWEYKQTKQYVSAGLGSSQFISILKFRFFNTPEINVLTLREK